MATNNVSIYNFNKSYNTSIIHSTNNQIVSAYLGSIDNTLKYNNATFDYRTYLTKSLGQTTTLDNSLFSLETLYKEQIDSILTDTFKLNFLFDSNRSITDVYKNLETVKTMNSIGIFDVSTCFYTTELTKMLPLTSSIDNENVDLILDKFDKSEELNKQYPIVQILNFEDKKYVEKKIVNENDEFIKFNGNISYKYIDDKLGIMSFISNYDNTDTPLYKSYYYNSTTKLNQIKIDDVIESIEFIKVVKNNSIYYAQIKTDNKFEHFYYSTNLINWKQISTFNNETNIDLTDNISDFFVLNDQIIVITYDNIYYGTKDGIYKTNHINHSYYLNNTSTTNNLEYKVFFNNGRKYCSFETFIEFIKSNTNSETDDIPKTYSSINIDTVFNSQDIVRRYIDEQHQFSYIYYETDRILGISIDNINFYNLNLKGTGINNWKIITIYNNQIIVTNNEYDIFALSIDDNGIVSVKNILENFDVSKYFTNTNLQILIQSIATDINYLYIIYEQRDDEMNNINTCTLIIKDIDNSENWIIKDDLNHRYNIIPINNKILLYTSDVDDNSNDLSIEDKTVEFIDIDHYYNFSLTLKEKYYKYYKFNKYIDDYYINLINEFKSKFISFFSEHKTNYHFILQFNVDSDKYSKKKINELYNYMVKMQKFISFVISCHSIIENGIDIYESLISDNNNSMYINSDYINIPHLYNILWSIIDTRLSKLDSINENKTLYNYFSNNLIKNNTGDYFKSRSILGYEIFDPLNESAASGINGDTNSSIDKIYSILNENIDKIRVILNNYDYSKDEDGDNNSDINKLFIIYLYISTIILQTFKVVTSTTSSKNIKLCTNNFDTLMKVFNIDYDKNYTEDEIIDEILINI